MKRIMIAVALFLSSCTSFIPAHAAEFKFGGKLTVLDSVAYSKNTRGDEAGSGGAVGVFVGSVAQIMDGDTKLIGLGGVLLTLSNRVGGEEPVAYSVSIVPLSLFDDSVQIGYGYNFTDGSPGVTVGLSLSKLLDNVK